MRRSSARLLLAARLDVGEGVVCHGGRCAQHVARPAHADQHHGDRVGDDVVELAGDRRSFLVDRDAGQLVTLALELGQALLLFARVAPPRLGVRTEPPDPGAQRSDDERAAQSRGLPVLDVRGGERQHHQDHGRQRKGGNRLAQLTQRGGRVERDQDARCARLERVTCVGVTIAIATKAPRVVRSTASGAERRRISAPPATTPKTTATGDTSPPLTSAIQAPVARSPSATSNANERQPRGRRSSWRGPGVRFTPSHGGVRR